MFVEGHAPVGKVGAPKGSHNSRATEFKPGQKAWNAAGLSKTCEHCGKTFDIAAHRLQRARFCSRTCADAGKVGVSNLAALGRKNSPETIEKMRIINRANARRGPDNPMWRGGYNTERRRLMQQFEYKNWRRSVFERDDYTCVECGARGVYLHAHHTVPWSVDETLRYEVSNGQTMCRPCHHETTFGKPLRVLEGVS